MTALTARPVTPLPRLKCASPGLSQASRARAMSLTTGTIDHADRYWCSGFRRCRQAPCLPSMSGFEMFCERCGKRYGSGEAAATSSLPLTKRFLLAVGVSTTVPKPPADEPFLRFCLACRGYSCPSCWNDEAGFCQTCVPLPEPVVEHPLVAVPDDR